MSKRGRRITPVMQWAILVLAGPKSEIDMIKNEGEIQVMFEKIVTFEISDSYGEFPDTTGYTADNFQQMESVVEDAALFPVMQKCMDAVIDFTTKRFEIAEKLGFKNLERHIHWPKFGGKIFAVTGHVVCMPSSFNLH